MWVACRRVTYSDLCWCFFVLLNGFGGWREGKDALVFEEALWFPCTKLLMLCVSIAPIRTGAGVVLGRGGLICLSPATGLKGRRETVISEDYSYLHCTWKDKLSQNTILLLLSSGRFQGVRGNRAGPQLCLSSLDVRYACNVLRSWNLFQGQRKLPSVYIGSRHILLAKFIRWLVLTVVTVDWLGNIYLCYNYLIS